MRRLVFQMLISLDGFFEGPNKELDWHNVDAEFNEYAMGLLNSVDGLLFGRVTYQLMAAYWPSEHALTDDSAIASKMNGLPKIVFSRTLKKSDWNNTRIVEGNAIEEVTRLKSQPGRDLAIFGSSDLALSLARANLIDEFRIIISPTILGKGKRLFDGFGERLNLKLVKTKALKSGNVILYYRPDISKTHSSS